MLALLLALACATPGTATPEDFAEAYAEAYCEWDASCSDNEWGHDECVATYGPAARDTFSDANCPAWDAAAAADCLAAYAEAAEGDCDDTTADAICRDLCG
jgi:hypothetical protein